ncbi:MAG: hypothetical protein OEX12_13160 [Gammaproteobacteria bacterium]|nr:hypothetical protein [Gammaproteobacteria bacterium]
MNSTGTHSKSGTSIITALEIINERVESLALIMNQMSDNSGFYAKQPVTQSQIDQLLQSN